MEVVEFLEQHNLDFRPSLGTQYLVHECPFCGLTNHFYIHQQTGLWDCKSCGEAGNLWTLRRHLERIDPVTSVTDLLSAQELAVTGVREDVIQGYQDALASDPVTVAWLLNRGITRGSIHCFRLGVLREGMATWLAIPYWEGGRIVNVKYRALPPQDKTFKLVPDHARPLYNIDALDKELPVFVVEGELDAIVMIQQGYTNTVSLPLGAGTFLPGHFDALVVCGRINLVLDMDPPGVKGTTEIAERLGAERCFSVKLPVNDVTDFFMRFSRPDFEALLAEAKTVGRSAVLSLAGTFDELVAQRAATEEREVGDVRFPWSRVDKIVGALQPGWLIVLQAIPFIGKTTFCLNTVAEIARKQEAPVLMYCLEMSPPKLLERVISSVRDTQPQLLSDQDITMARAELFRAPLYFGRSTSADIRVDKVFETIRYSVKRFGIRLVVFDHLHFLVRSAANQTQEVGHVVRSFKLLLEELQIPGILIAHPTKMNPSEVPGLYAARDSGEIAGDADVLISLFRQPTSKATVGEDDFVSRVAPTFSPQTLVTVTASRFVPGGTAVLYFVGDSMRFEELGE